MRGESGPEGSAVIEAERAGTRFDDARDQAEALPAVRALFDALAAHDISCCLWKSNQHLEAALAGRTDLDLLVASAQAPQLRAILAGHGVKALVAPPHMTYPATEHYLGYDASTGGLFHVHAQYQLVLGEKYVKNYRLPLERQFLDSVRVRHGVPVPRPELELAVLAARVLLKYRVRDVVKDVLGIRSPGITAEFRTELAWLHDQTSVGDVREALRALDVLPSEVICSFLDTSSRAPRAGLRLLVLRTRLRRHLRGRRRHHRAIAYAKYARGAWERRQKFRRRDRGTKLQLATGGTTIGLVGADGAGKSTAADIVNGWLGWKLDTGIYYMGSKAPSHCSRGLYIVFRALRRSHRGMSARVGPGAHTTRFVRRARDVALALHLLSIGSDRARRHRRARRDAETGSVVIFDRFPLEALRRSDAHRLLDGPQIATAVDGHDSRIVRALGATEERMYRQFGLPDELIALHVTPDVAVARKPDHARDVVGTKSRAVVSMAGVAKGRGARVHDVDANRSLEAVLLDVKSEVWNAL
jgi:thymidylate kinase